jgi:MFS family permease
MLKASLSNAIQLALRRPIMPAEAAEARQPLWFLLLLALAVAGGAAAYIPFLTILLPVRISELVGAEDVASLSYIIFAGAIFASFANIGFGWLSDITNNRRGWIAGGMALSSALLVFMGEAKSIGAMIILVIVWQIGLNMMLSPLIAWAGDCVPDGQKGLLGGLFAFAPALGAIAGALVTQPGLASSSQRLILVAALVCAMVLPALFFGRNRTMRHLVESRDPAREGPNDALQSPFAIGVMWLARLLVQIAEAGLFVFLLYWLRTVSPGFGENSAARLFGTVLLIAVPIALMIGYWSDKSNRPILPLSMMAGLAATGLFCMAISDDLTGAVVGYALFGIASTIFLSLHSGQTLRVLPKPATRGRDLGFFNLTNTLPALIMPGLTLSLVPVFGFSGLFAVFGMLSIIAALMTLTIARRN